MSIEYCMKYIMKSEPCSQSLKEVFTTIVRSLKNGNTSIKAVQKLLIHSVGERDYSAQETCHLLLQLPMFKASREFIVLSLDGSHAVEERLEEHNRATALSILGHYVCPPNMAISDIGNTPCQRYQDQTLGLVDCDCPRQLQRQLKM